MLARPALTPIKTLPKLLPPPDLISIPAVPSLFKMLWTILEKVISFTEILSKVPVQLASGVKVKAPLVVAVITCVWFVRVPADWPMALPLAPPKDTVKVPVAVVTTVKTIW